jgi:DNA-binding Lrp family transcriptional regulator
MDIRASTGNPAGGCPTGADALDALDLALIRATQAGLPLTPRPYQRLAQQLGSSEQCVMQRLNAMLASGVIRRIAALPNHYRLGYTANGMSVWDVPDEHIAQAGAEVAALPFVSHCYERPRRLPQWRHNLFAMLHGRTREEVEAQRAAVAALLGRRQHGHEVLYSTRILKKTGLRLAE